MLTFFLEYLIVHPLDKIKIDRLRVFENTLLRKIFVPGQRILEGWIGLNNEELHDLHCLKNTCNLGDQINKKVMALACVKFGELERTIQGFGGEM